MRKRPVDRVLFSLVHLLGAFGAAAGKEPPAAACQEEPVEVGAKTKTGGEGAGGARRVRLRAALRQRLNALRRARRRQPLGRALRRALAAQRIAVARRFRAQAAGAAVRGAARALWAAAERRAAAGQGPRSALSVLTRIALERDRERALATSAVQPVAGRAGRPAAAAGGGGGSSEASPAGGGAAGPSAGSGGSGSGSPGAGGGAWSGGSGGGSPGAGNEVGGGGGGVGGAPPPHSVSLRILAAGHNGYGQLGVLPARAQEHALSEPPILTPVIASGLHPPQGDDIVKIGCGAEFVLVLTAQGAVLHAGANDGTQRANGERDYAPHQQLCPVPLPCPAVDIACGRAHAAAALSSGAVATWGATDVEEYRYSQLGRAGEGNTPEAVEGVAEAERVYAGSHSTFFLLRGGEVAACGCNNWGQLALGHEEMEVYSPQRAAALCGRRILQLQGGDTHCIMLEADGSVWVWGMLPGVCTSGILPSRLADGSAPWSAERGCVPIRLAAGPALCVSAGCPLCAAVTAEGALLLWGKGFAGQPSPVRLPGGQPAAAVVCSWRSVWARSAAGEWAACGAGCEGLPFGSGHNLRELRPIGEAARLCMPLSGSMFMAAFYLEGCGAEEIWRRSAGCTPASGVLRVGGRELWEADLSTPLSDVGGSAECVVQLLRVPRLPPAAGRAGSAGTLCVYVDASPVGETDRVCVELRPDATVQDLVAAAAARLGLGA